MFWKWCFENCFHQNPRKEAACCEGASGDETKKQQGQATAFHFSEGKFQVKLIRFKLRLVCYLFAVDSKADNTVEATGLLAYAGN